MVLNGIGIGGLLFDIFWTPQNFISKLPGIALAIWAEIIAFGARQEVKSEANIAIEAGQELKSGRYIWIPSSGENQRNFVAFLNTFEFAF